MSCMCVSCLTRAPSPHTRCELPIAVALVTNIFNSVRGQRAPLSLGTVAEHLGQQDAAISVSRLPPFVPVRADRPAAFGVSLQPTANQLVMRWFNQLCAATNTPGEASPFRARAHPKRNFLRKLILLTGFLTGHVSLQAVRILRMFAGVIPWFLFPLRCGLAAMPRASLSQMRSLLQEGTLILPSGTVPPEPSAALLQLWMMRARRAS
jgi:hypothetical protein